MIPSIPREAIWLFLLGCCRRLANAAPSPSISSGFDPDIGSADICPRCPVSSVFCVREFREREDYVPDAEHELRFPLSFRSDIIRRFSQKIPFSLLFYLTKFAYIKKNAYLCTRFQKCSFSRLEQPLVAVHSNVLQHPASPRNRLDLKSRFYKT